MTVALIGCIATLILIIVYVVTKSVISKKGLRHELDELKEKSNREISHLQNCLDSVISMSKQSEMLAFVTRQTSNAVMLMNAEGDILWINDSFARMYEYTYEEFTAKLGNNIRKTSFNPKIMERLNHCYTKKRR